MNIKSLIITSTAFFAGISGAHAADIIVYEEPVLVEVATPAFSWAGAYIGGQVGYGWGKSDFHDDGYVFKTKPDGFLGGLYAGYNFDAGSNVILGIDGDLTINNLKGKYSESFPNIDERHEISSKLRWSGAVRARTGLAMDRWMPYIAGGVAFGGIKNGTRVIDGSGTYASSKSDTLTGWTLGAGIDYAATDNLIVRLEYRYTDYGNKNVNIPVYGYEFEATNKFKTSDIRLGVAYKF